MPFNRRKNRFIDNADSLDFHLKMSNFCRSVPFIDEINLKGEQFCKPFMEIDSINSEEEKFEEEKFYLVRLLADSFRLQSSCMKIYNCNELFLASASAILTSVMIEWDGTLSSRILMDVSSNCMYKAIEVLIAFLDASCRTL